MASFKDEFPSSEAKERFSDHNEDEGEDDNEDPYSPAKEKSM